MKLVIVIVGGTWEPCDERDRYETAQLNTDNPKMVENIANYSKKF